MAAIKESSKSNSAIATSETGTILGSHLGAFAKGVDAIMVDYTEQSLVITPDKTYRGLKEIHAFFDAFLKGAESAFWDAFKIRTQIVDGNVAYLVWEAKPFVPMATDTLIVQNKKILTQTFTAFAN